MRFLVDMPLSPGLALWLSQLGHDAVHASQIDLARAADTAIIDRATQELRVIVTADLDYPRLLAAMGTRGPGLILLRHGDYSEQEAIEAVKRVLRAVPGEELSTSIVVVDQRRVRRRRLPIDEGEG